MLGATLRFTEAGYDVLSLGPVGVGKTHLATALGHIAIRRRMTVGFHRADKLFTRLRAARLDNTLDAEIRRLTSTDVLIIDDFALRSLDATQTNDFYEIVVERHRRASTIWVSNREPAEWLGLTSDALLAQPAIDRFTSGAHTLIVEGPSYRQRQRVTIDPRTEAHHARYEAEELHPKRSLARHSRAFASRASGSSPFPPCLRRVQQHPESFCFE